jgi:uncharacterized membrane protein (DUF2068 family)
MNRPVGAYIIAALVGLRGAWALLTGVLGFTGGTLGVLTGYTNEGATLVWLSLGTLIVGAITLYMAYGLFAGKAWAWMIGIIFLVIGLGVDLLAWFTGSTLNWIGVILSVIVLIYMLTPRVRESYLQ